MEAGSRIPVKSIRCNSLDWDSDSGKTGTVKRRPVSTELPGNDSKTGKVSDTDSGIHSPLSPDSVYGVFKLDTVCDTSAAKPVCKSCELERVKVRFFIFTLYMLTLQCGTRSISVLRVPESHFLLSPPI